MDVDIALTTALEPVMGRKLDVDMRTDFKSLFDTITKASQTSEKRPLMDIDAVRESYRGKQSADVN